ncbi:peptide chain release factor 1 [Bacteroidetes bacterium endosymbiont of Geopemphigus sp.]|uniref:peptide chain release factor 1 n=1 Tax=Bacteroidetes bacterium endosymbiont of Geopemphigus sp. TaxID=2047937 RepID=UPI000CD1F4CF|nr:peptide chain release factor 1 [Bacteroidetes bacterium endosymbiont of Geopemphigus sp.]
MKKSSLMEKLGELRQRFDEIADLIIQPEVITDKKHYALLSRQYKELEKIVYLYQLYKEKHDALKETQEILSQSSESLELRGMAQEEKDRLLPEIQQMESQIQYMLIPKDSEDDKNVIVELRVGTGGDEACIFVENILRMYSMYFKERGWSYQILNAQESTVKGYKEVILDVRGEEGVYGILKFESGVHRVQRVPETESQGRVHTSAITVAVLPEVQAVEVDINPADIKRDTFRSSGSGGQHVNKTESAIRLTHLPTGVVVECQEERSQHKNYEKALSVLRARIYQVELEKKAQERASERKSLVSTGDRSAKIRTYNYPQGRVTDHRINKSIYSLDEFMNGRIQEMIDALRMVENAERLKEQE